MRPVSSEPPRPGDLVVVHKELTFTTTETTVTHTIETENVEWCVVTGHGTTPAAAGVDQCHWSISGTTLTLTRGASGTSALVVTVLYCGAPTGVQV
jgi:hypothetical protein